MLLKFGSEVSIFFYCLRLTKNDNTNKSTFTVLAIALQSVKNPKFRYYCKILKIGIEDSAVDLK